MNFWDAFYELFLRSGKLPDGYSDSAILVFTAGCGAMGLIVVIFDRIVFTVKNKSFLGLRYGGFVNDVRLITLWSLASAIGGFLGASADIFQCTRFGCIGGALGWILILQRLIDLFAPKTRKGHDS